MSLANPAKLVAFTGIFLAAGVLLVGCSPLHRSAARIEDGAVVFAVCSDVEARDITGDIRDLTRKSRSSDEVWNVSGRGQLASGTTLKFGSDVDGFASTKILVRPDEVAGIAHSTVGVIINAYHEGDRWTAQYRIADLKTDSWRDQDGNDRKTPCEPGEQ